MTLELWNTFATFGTFVVIAATAIAALVQLQHLRAGNQINAMLSIGTQYDDKTLREARTLISHKVASALEDPLFREYELAMTRNLPTPIVPDEHVQL